MSSTRDTIISTADILFYEQGFEHTSFADIAGAVGISRGNFYHHFKSKDDILTAVIAKRLEDRRQWLAAWNVMADSPKTAIRQFIDILIVNRDKITRFGCPVGSLVAELAKLSHPSRDEANSLFTLFRDWLEEHFQAMGMATESPHLAMYLLAQSQGIASMMNAFGDPDFTNREVNRLYEWLDQLESIKKDQHP